jgi:hypothetical protein
MIVFSRKYTPLKIMRDGQKIGEIVRGHHGSYGLFLDGIYWDRCGCPTRRGGSSGKGFNTLREAKAAIPYQLLEDSVG